MNNLTDISMDKTYASLCGYTQEEMEYYFKEPIKDLADTLGKSEQNLSEQIKYWYNGYCFEENAPSVYNPYSVLSLFYKQKFENFWFQTATPTFLIDLIKNNEYDLSQLNDYEVGSIAINATEPEHLDVLSVFCRRVI